ncbi:hypothetical protein ACJ2A9_09760 [Anaerobacillus sp. MEB173]|uniref:hypothetical protein n=1 Tax=Anaerobacillus sp. MEB173 TaxID=3383345 RepID=UPI003F8ED06C
MFKRMFFSLILVGCLVLIAYLFFNYNYSNEAILGKVTDRNGYTLNQVKTPVTVELFIQPGWIPLNSNEKKEINIKLKEDNNTMIILKSVWNRGTDIYFSFTTTYNLNRNNGNFLYNGIFNKDGTFTSFGSSNDFYLYNNKNEKIEVGQTGRGPKSDFSFGITSDNYSLLEDGFYVKYYGFILYDYSKN